MCKKNSAACEQGCCICKPIPHKHADVIKAYADGFQIQYRTRESDPWSDWTIRYCPAFNELHEYRVKPEPKPDRIVTDSVYPLVNVNGIKTLDNYPDNVRFIFDGETGKLKSVEII